MQRLAIPKNAFGLLAWFLALMLLFWAPLPGEQRVPFLLLLALGLWLQLRHPEQIPTLPGIKLLRWALLLLVIPCLVSLPFSVDPESSLRIVAVLAMAYWAGLAMLAGLASRPTIMFITAIGLIFALWATDGLVQWHWGSDLLGIPLWDTRVVGPFGDNLRMSVMMGIMLPVILYPLSKRWPWISILVLALLTLVIALSGARASLVFAILTGAGLLFWLPRWPQRLALLVACAGVIVFASMESPQLKQRMVNANNAQFPQSRTEISEQGLYQELDTFLSGRLTIWETGWHMFTQHPLIGIGAGAFDEAYDAYATRPDDPFRSTGAQPISHAHQLYVSAAAETGSIGLICLATLIALSFRWYRALTPAARRQAYPFAYSLLVAFFPMNSQHGIFIGWWFFTLLLLYCAMLVAGERTNSSPAEHSP